MLVLERLFETQKNGFVSKLRLIFVFVFIFGCSDQWRRRRRQQETEEEGERDHVKLIHSSAHKVRRSATPASLPLSLSFSLSLSPLYQVPTTLNFLKIVKQSTQAVSCLVERLESETRSAAVSSRARDSDAASRIKVSTKTSFSRLKKML